MAVGSHVVSSREELNGLESAQGLSNLKFFSGMSTPRFQSSRDWVGPLLSPISHFLLTGPQVLLPALAGTPVPLLKPCQV